MGEAPARKATGLLINSPCIAMELQRRCPNRRGHMQHRHVILMGGRTKDAQVYPEGLCRAICQGLINQMEADKKGQFMLAKLNGTNREMKDVKEQLQQLHHRYKIAEEDYSSALEAAWGDVTGAELDPQMVKQARSEEVKCIHKMKLYKKVNINECSSKMGKAPIKVRWIDINKEDIKEPNYRSRLVVKEIDTCKRDDLFAAILPLEAAKMIFSMTATANH